MVQKEKKNRPTRLHDQAMAGGGDEREGRQLGRGLVATGGHGPATGTGLCACARVPRRQVTRVNARVLRRQVTRASTRACRSVR
jgi:hypothetical protein